MTDVEKTRTSSYLYKKNAYYIKKEVCKDERLSGHWFTNDSIKKNETEKRYRWILIIIVILSKCLWLICWWALYIDYWVDSNQGGDAVFFHAGRIWALNASESFLGKKLFFFLFKPTPPFLRSNAYKLYIKEKKTFVFFTNRITLNKRMVKAKPTRVYIRII